MLHLLLLLLVVVVVLAGALAASVDGQLVCHSDDHDALVVLNVSGWTAQSCCQWKGVTCGEAVAGAAAARVVGLALPNVGLRGAFPSSLASLVYLRSLDLSGNSLCGSVLSAELPSSLEMLNLSCNNLSGAVTFLGGLSALRVLNLSHNRFEEGLPLFWGFPNLTEFRVGSNFLTGLVPTGICQHVPLLRVLDLANNRFTGGVPGGLGACAHLEVLDLGVNELSGSIPHQLFNSTSLQHLCLSFNHLDGHLSGNISRLSNLREFHLGHNNFSGVPPPSLSNLTRLEVLSLASNNFVGLISFDCRSLRSLKSLDINSNLFSGSIPPSLADCASLENLNLAKNDLIGEIPRAFNRMQNLSILSLSSNGLSGSLDALSNCTSLVSLILSKNNFTEQFPGQLNGFYNLQVLALGNIHLFGEIEPWLQNCTKLQILDLSWNFLAGALPPWLGDFKHLFYVDLSNNSFSGSIPPQLFHLSALTIADNGTQIGMKPVESVLSIKRQQNSPDLRYNQAANFPPSLYLSHNHLVGAIPHEVGLLQLLLNLDLSYNNLSGSIPSTLANISRLQSLDLSINKLAGVIPLSLTKLTFLAMFNVSFNNLSGTVPMGFQFSTFTTDSYAGNQYLCIPSNSTCDQSSPHSGESPVVASEIYQGRRRMNRVTILIPICVALGLAGVLVVTLFCVLSRRNAVYQGNDSTRDMDIPKSLVHALDSPVELFHSHEKLLVRDLFKATNEFDSSNIVGCGGFGLVFRADLADGSKLAVKKLTGDCGQMEREFKAEVEALSKARHPNLVSLLGYFHVGNDRLLIYSYMENGSLDYWLHERCDAGSCLDWPMRLKIAQGAARGLSYLHQICSPHIVHRDIKSSNILLDEKFEAHLADFGLARLMLSTDSHVTTELVGTLGYIPPEYGQAFNATLRGDVYSFGVVLLELLTGKRPVDVSKGKAAGDLVAWARILPRDGKAKEIFDCQLLNKGSEEQMLKMLDIACLCINQNPLKRPTIKTVVSQLEVIGSDDHYCK